MSREQVMVVDLLAQNTEFDDELYDADVAALWGEDEVDEYEEFEAWAREQKFERDKQYRIGE